jgi:hypothetical protein
MSHALPKWSILILSAVALVTTSVRADVSLRGPVIATELPAALDEGLVESDQWMFVFAEQRCAYLDIPVVVNVVDPGVYTDFAQLVSVELPAGMVVSSYLVHFDPVGISSRIALQATLRFDEDIAGIILESAWLQESDASLGVSGAAYPSPTRYRGLDLDINPDVLVFHNDGRSVTISLQATDWYDQVRIVTRHREVAQRSTEEE